MNEQSIGKRIIALLLMVILLGNAPDTGALAATSTGTISAKAQMRASTKSSSKLIYTLKKGTKVTILGTKSKYTQISYKGKKGYVKSSAVKKSGSKQQVVQAQPSVKGTEAATTRSASLFKSAKTSAKKLIKTVKKGTKVLVTSTEGKWKKVTVSGKSGYMLASAFTVPAKATPKPEPTAAPAKATPKPTASPKPAAVKSKTTAQMLTTIKTKMYQGRNTSSKSVGVPKDSVVSVVKQTSKWYTVEYKGKGGYMLASAFQDTVEENTRMYQKASTKAKSVSVKKGSKVAVYGIDDDWVEVKKGTKKGFIKLSAFEKPEPSPTPTPAPTADAKTRTMKTTVKASMYQKPTTSAKHVSVKVGTTVTISGETGNWYKVKIKSKGGYMKKAAFEVPAEPTPAPSKTPAPETYKTLKSGSKGDAVRKLQDRLEDLGYFDGVPAGNYSAITSSAVKLFQSENGIKATGTADNATQQKLYSSSAKQASILSVSLKSGSKGNHVKRLQNRLKYKGYFSGKINGVYGASTGDAVTAYQKQVGLTADGNAGKNTLSSLFSGNAPAYKKPDSTPKPTTKPTASPTKEPSSSRKPQSAADKKKADTVIAAAMAKLGKPYVFGATGPNSYDCSGFTMYAYATVGIKLPHSAYSQGYSCGTKVSYSQLQRGDLVCWNTVSDSDLSDHVGIYLGNGQAIHASSGTGKVIISSISSGYYQRAFSWGRDLF